jgi:DNA-binding response OmpR family regulator
VTPDVLLVEDDHDLRVVFGRMLTRLGIAYRTAADVTSALANLVERHTAVVLLDLGLGRGDGYEVLAEIRRDRSHPYTQVVIVSGESPPAAWPADLEPDGYLRKPVDMRELAAAVRKHLRIFRELTAAPA